MLNVVATEIVWELAPGNLGSGRNLVEVGWGDGT
jgi:hypothetical protein